MVVYPPSSIPATKYRTLPVFKADLARLARLARGTLRLLEVTTTPTPPVSTSTLTIDIETIGHSPAIERLGLCGDDGKVWSAHWSPTTRATLQRLLDTSPLIIGHNLSFDIPRLAASGVVFPKSCPLFDTMLGSHLLYPDFYKGLGRIASLYLDVPRWKHLSATNPALYNAYDVAVTYALFQAQVPLLKTYGLWDLFMGTIMPSIPTLIAMTVHGLSIDHPHLATWRLGLESEVLQLHKSLREMAPTVLPTSNPQLQRFLYGTSTGSVDEAALTSLAHHLPSEHPRATYISTLLDFREKSKLLTTYTNFPLGSDGRIHPSFLPASKDATGGTAATGRLASSDPNVQNLPPIVRRIVIPSRAGLHLAEFDYSQIELRIAAHQANDRALIAALEGDVHAVTMEALGCDRVRAKNVTYGTLYGAGPGKLSVLLTTRGFPTSISEAESLQTRFFASYPDLAAWRRSIIHTVCTTQRLRNPFGRLRHFYSCYLNTFGEPMGSEIPEALDFIPQSTAADIMWDRLRPVDDTVRALGGALLAQIHDSFLVELPLDCDPTPIATTMQVEFPNIAPGFFVPAHIKVGPNWGSMEDYHAQRP